MSNIKVRDCIIVMLLLSGIAIWLDVELRAANTTMATNAIEFNRIQTINETQKKLIKLQDINIENRKQLREQENTSCRSSAVFA